MVFIFVFGLMNGLNFAAVFFANVVGQKQRANHSVGQIYLPLNKGTLGLQMKPIGPYT
jgi:hypothetical protein